MERDFLAVRASQALLDGVLVALDRHGRLRGRALEYATATNVSAGGSTANGAGSADAELARSDEATPSPAETAAPGAPAGAVAYYAFDLLHYDDWICALCRWSSASKLLRSLLPPQPALLYADHVTASGESLAAVAADAGFHGLVAKRAASRYRSGARPTGGAYRCGRPPERARWRCMPPCRRPASRQRRQADVQFSNLDKVYCPAKGTPRATCWCSTSRSPTTCCPTCATGPCT